MNSEEKEVLRGLSIMLGIGMVFLFLPDKVRYAVGAILIGILALLLTSVVIGMTVILRRLREYENDAANRFDQATPRVIRLTVERED
ncbi:hypothetical protein [Actinomadura sp. 9N215]|uniref:hypothetical protein n=1 Tax=Actinomadura sp. 9N215 TaxID=3375150 RepID=UPI0037BB2611